jgi:hypothetical protein
MLTQIQIYRHHVGNCLQLENSVNSSQQNTQQLLTQLIHRFGYSFRRFYCGFVCDNRYECAVRSLPAFNIHKVYDVAHLTTFPVDYTLGLKVHGCHHPVELNAIQLFLVNDFIPFEEEYVNYPDNNELKNQEIMDKRRAFLYEYGTIFQQMFCGTICPTRAECKKGNHCVPQRYA